MPVSLRFFARGGSIATCVAGLACNSLTGADDIEVCDPDVDLDCSTPGSGGSANGGGGSSGGPGGSANGGGGTSGAGGGSGGSTSGAGGQGMGGGPALQPVLGSVGANCSDQLSCAPGRTCLTSASSLPVMMDSPGGPEDGYCTAPCTSTADCIAVDPMSDCDPAIGYCIALCQTQSGGCPGSGVACAVLGTPTIRNDAAPGACIPVCGADELCEGRFCNFSTGLCQDAPRAGAGFGAACVLDSDCSGGLCLALGASRFCTGGCALGSTTAACGYSTNPAAPPAALREAGCIDYNPFAGQGDVGLCQELCTAPADCSQLGFRCEPLSAEESLRLGRFGFCMPPDAICNNTCQDADDQFCDDGGADADTSLCALGSDCADCGPRPALMAL